MHIYKNLLLKEFPNALNIMHLTAGQVREIMGMGHSIGAHTRFHVSIGATRLTKEETKKELDGPKKYLEKSFSTKVNALAYPFGLDKDCLATKDLINKTKQYKLAFSVKDALNTPNSPPLELGRHSVYSNEDEDILKKKLDEITQCQIN
jgi:peptidoglycan/xylan/chitin deacetylase (PgdA/CDA1 family)